MRTRPTTVRAADGTVYALTMSPDEAAALLGLGRSSAYEMVSNGTWPTPTTPASSTTHRILTLPLLQYAGVQWEFVRPTTEQSASGPDNAA
jgi:hypothetical protein